MFIELLCDLEGVDQGPVRGPEPSTPLPVPSCPFLPPPTLLIHASIHSRCAPMSTPSHGSGCTRAMKPLRGT